MTRFGITTYWNLAICASCALLLAAPKEPLAAAENGRTVTVQVPVAQLNAIEQELHLLRQRDQERQAFEAKVMSQWATGKFEFAGHTFRTDNAPPVPACDVVADSVCDASVAGGCDSRGCCCGHCFRCQCPLPTAPCLECNHVSTLSPYFNVHLFGALKLDMLMSTARTVSPGTPFFLTPDSVAGLDQNIVSFHARQSTLGAAFTGPQMGCFQAGGAVVAMFFNDAVIVDQYGFLPLQAWGDLKNDNWRLAGGLMFDVFAPGMPTVLPFSALAASGNAGNSFRGQLRLERFVHSASDVQWTLQGALSDPITTTIDPNFRIYEDNGWPNVEGRIALGLGDLQGAGPAAKRPLEMGLSGVVGQLRGTALPPIGRVVEDVWGIAVDGRWMVSECFGFLGEVYTGQGLGTYNAAILQTANLNTLQALRSTGGFGEVFFYWTPCLHTHLGFGVDDPLDNRVSDDPALLGRTFNSTIYANALWDLNQVFRVGFEFTWRETNYKAAALPDNEGAGFHTQLQWVF